MRKSAPVQPEPAEPPGESRATPAAVQSVGMAFAVLEALAGGEPVGTSELARRLGETKARVHRHLSTLRSLGLVQKDPASDGYALGWKSYRLGTSLVENFGLRKLAHRHLLRLHRESGQTVALAMAAGADVTVVEAIQSTADIAITIRSGSTIPALSSALGRAVLAFQSADVREAALAAPIAPRSPDTPMDAKRLAQVLDVVRQRRYEVAAGERLPGIAALAAPVFDDRNEAVGSVGVIGMAGLVKDSPVLRDQVLATAARISAELGATAWDDRSVRALPRLP
ncbi:MAG: IclR family transcriptional regulator [Ramlibacter sp.]